MIRPLPKLTSDQMRASSTIGSTSRAVEELVRNSIVHGKAKHIYVQYSAGMQKTSLQVKDDGSGIEPDALEKYIGVRHCSSNPNGVHDIGVTMFQKGSMSSPSSSSSPYFARKDRTQGGSCDKDSAYIENVAMNDRNSGASLLALVTLSDEVYIVSGNSVKRFQKGKVMAFKRTTQGGLQTSNVETCISISGLFHRHAVRRKYQLKLLQQKSNPDSSSFRRAELSSIRNCIRQLALAYPLVSISFHSRNLSNDSSSKTSTSVLVDEWKLSAPYYEYDNLFTDDSDQQYFDSLSFRMSQDCGFNYNCTMKGENFLRSIKYNEEFRSCPKSSSLVRGIIWTGTMDGKMYERSTNCQFIFINGRILQKMSLFIPLIEEWCTVYNQKFELNGEFDNRFDSENDLVVNILFHNYFLLLILIFLV